VARAIAACSVPVVSAVGHETDVTIADFVADLRAPTPSAAAEMVVRTREELLDRIAAARANGTQAMRYRLAMLERRLRQRGIESALSALDRRVGRGLQRIDELEYRLRERIRAELDARGRARRAMEARLQGCDVRLRLARSRGALDRLTGQLSTLSPLRILERGYAIVSGAAGILKDAGAAPPDSRIHVRLAKGELDAVVRASRRA